MIKKIENLDVEDLPQYETMQGDSFSFRATIKDGINAEKVSTIRIIITDECQQIKLIQDFIKQSDNLWLLNVKSESTMNFISNRHFMKFQVVYLDGNISTFAKAVLWVSPYGTEVSCGC